MLLLAQREVEDLGQMEWLLSIRHLSRLCLLFAALGLNGSLAKIIQFSCKNIVSTLLENHNVVVQGSK